MNLSQQIAKHFRDVYFGKNWTWVNLKDTLEGITWEQATAKVHSFNTIAVLVFHIHYYIGVATKVLQGGPVDGHDKYAFDAPPIRSQDDWGTLVNKVFSEGEAFAKLIEQLPETKFDEIFGQEKYGTYYRNLQGIIEHTHYHLGQIALIKKIVQQPEPAAP
jgi:hypothetical protein